MGIKDYVAKKREAFHAYQDKREAEKMDKMRTRKVQERLETESLIEEGKAARTELKSLREASSAREDIAKVKKHVKTERFKRSTLGKTIEKVGSFGEGLGTGFESFQEGIGKISAVSEKLGGAKQSYDPFGSSDMGGGLGGGRSQNMDPFGGNMFGMGGGSTSPKKKKATKKKRSKKKGRKR